MITGDTLRAIRILKGIKQDTVARKLKISQPAYSKLEKHDFIKEEKLKEILKILKCNEEDLKMLQQIKNQ